MVRRMPSGHDWSSAYSAMPLDHGHLHAPGAQHRDDRPATSHHHNRIRSLSLSMPWRRSKSSMLAPEDARDPPQQLSEVAVDDEADYHEQQPRPRGSSHSHASHHPGSIKGMFRRASISLRGVVRRQPSIATEEAIFEGQPYSSEQRPTTSHLGWNPPRHQTGIRHSRSFYGLDFTQEPLPMAHRPTHASTAPYNPRPGVGVDPPIIPPNTGSAAKAAAAMQNEFLARHGLQHRWLHPTAGEGNDDESGVGISVTAPGAKEAPISKVDFIANLPTELAIHILAYLDASALAKASLTSRRWREIVSNQHIWRESCLRELTGTYAMGEPVQPNMGLGLPRNLPTSNWRQIYRVKKELDQRWKQGKARPVYLNGHTDSIYCLQFDEHKIITGSRDRTIRVWDMHALECRLVIGPPDVVKKSDLLVDQNGEAVHYASDADGLKTSLSVPAPLSFEEHHNASILCLQYDDRILATGSSDASCIIYDMQNGYRPIRRLRTHTAAILDLAFDDKHIVTCSKDISICVWDRETGALVRQLRGHQGPVNAVQMRGNTIVSCSGDFRVKLWNIDTGKNIREFIGHTKGLACSQFSEDGRYVASAGNDKTIRIWDANTGECLREMRAHENLVRSLHIDSVSGRLVSGSYDTDIKVWDMESGRQLLDFPHWHASWVLSAKSDYRRIVSTGQDPKILIMDFGADVEGIEMLESGGRDAGGESPGGGVGVGGGGFI